MRVLHNSMEGPN